jgi:hypothetical protein
VVSSGPNAGTAVTPSDNGDGTWDVTYTPTLAGTDVIDILLDPDGGGGQPAAAIGTAGGIPGGPSPYTVTVIPAAVDGASSTVETVTPGGTVGGSVLVTITVQLRDQFGNALTASDGGPLAAAFQGGSASSGQLFTITDNLDGTITVEYTTASSGSDDVIDLTYTDAGGTDTIIGSPVTVTRS